MTWAFCYSLTLVAVTVRPEDHSGDLWWTTGGQPCRTRAERWTGGPAGRGGGITSRRVARPRGRGCGQRRRWRDPTSRRCREGGWVRGGRVCWRTGWTSGFLCPGGGQVPCFLGIADQASTRAALLLRWEHPTSRSPVGHMVESRSGAVDRDSCASSPAQAERSPSGCSGLRGGVILGLRPGAGGWAPSAGGTGLCARGTSWTTFSAASRARPSRTDW